MKKILAAIILIILSISFNASSVSAQESQNETAYNNLKIVFQLTSGDTILHQTLMNQLKNYFTVAPDLKVEVVCHGGGLSMLVKNSCVVQKEIKSYIDKGVNFVACEFAMKKRKITKDQLIDGASTVTSGVLEIAKKQQEGWSYIKL